MPTYDVDVGGKTYEVDAPDPNTAWQWANYTARQEAQKSERTWGEAVTDVGAGLVQGAGSLVSLPGQLYGLATGDFSPTGALGLGQSITQAGEEMKSEGLKFREAESAKAVQEAEKNGQLSAFATRFVETVTDPAQLSNFLATVVPQLILPAGAAKLAAGKVFASTLEKGVAAGLSQEAAKKAAQEAAIKYGTAAAKGAGATMQGAEVGTSSYEDIYKKLIEQGASETEAADQAIGLARSAGAGAGVVSFLAQSLPGASALEAKFAGKAGAGRIATGVKEAGSEMLEEAPGQAIQNLAMQQVDPTQSLMEGVGASAAQALIGGLGAGLTLGSGPSAAEQEQAKQKEQQAAFEEERKAEIDRLEKERAQTEKVFGVDKDQPLALPAPAEEADLVPEDRELTNPVGNIAKNELAPEVVSYIDKYRKDNGLPRLNSYSIEDVRDAMTQVNPAGEQAALDSILAAKTGYTGEEKFSTEDVLNAAVEKNIATDTKGFNDFLERTTGQSTLENMSQPQLYSAFKALKDMKRDDTTEQLVLPEGTNAARFTTKQYTNAVKLANMAVEESGGKLGFDSLVTEIKEATNLETDRDALAILDAAIKNEDLRESTETVFRTYKEGSDTPVATYSDKAKANEAAKKQRLNVKEETLRQIIPAEKAAPKIRPSGLPQGYRIEETTLAEAETPAAYGITVEGEGKPISTVKTQEEAPAKIERLQALRAKRAEQMDENIAKANSAINRGQAQLDRLEADGKGGTEIYQKLQAKQASRVKTLGNRIKLFEEQKAKFLAPLQVKPVGKRTPTRTSYKVTKGGETIGSFPSQQAAEESVISQLSDAELETLAAGEVSRVSNRAAVELEGRRSGKKGIAVKGTKERLEKAGVETTEFQQKVKDLEAKLVPMLAKFGLKDVALKIVRQVEGGKAEGSYINKLIEIAMDAQNPIRTMRHEAIHALKNLGFFTPQQWTALQRQAKEKWVDKYLAGQMAEINGKVMTRLDAYKQLGLTESEIIEEAIADAFADFDVNGKAPAGLLQALFKRLQNFFKALRSAFGGAGFESAEEIFGKIEEGKLAKQVKTMEASVEKLSLAPKGIPQDIWNQHERSRLIEENAVETMQPQQKSAATRSWRTLNKMVENYTADDQAALKMMQEMNTISGIREAIANNDNQAIAAYKVTDPGLYAQETGEKLSLKPSEANAWQADKDTVKQADTYAEENGILPYVSGGFLEVPKDARKFSVQKYNPEKHLRYDPILGLPINKDGMVTLYYHTTKENAVSMGNKKSISSEGKSRIYFTNESVGADVLRDRGNFDQNLDGSTVLVYVNPELLQLDAEYSNGRRDFFVPVAQGEAFNSKMKLQSIQKGRTSAITETFSYSEHEDKISDAVKAYQNATPAERKKLVSNAKKVLKSQHNVSSLLSENGKLEKTRVNDYDLDWDGNSVASMGLGLASAQQISEKVSTCPRSAICEGLCLGETSGGNLMFGGAATEDVADIQKSSFRAAARMMQYLKTEALILNPKEFATLLQHEIKLLEKWCASPTLRTRDKETGKVVNKEKEIYQSAVRLNVTSDFKPSMFRAIIEQNPDTMFYDYTKLGSESISDNHHLTYSSTGFGQIVDGEKVFFKDKSGKYDHNWATMRSRLNKGQNVAMAFSSKSGIPDFLLDEETGNRYKVWNGDDYDARFLDPKQPNGKGMIIGLKNKAGTLSEKTATKKTGGFFVQYDPKTDGDTVIVPSQDQFKDGRKVIPIETKLSLKTHFATPEAAENAAFKKAAPTTPEFKRFFGASQVAEEGRPKVMFHASPNEFEEFSTFKPIFVSEDAKSAEFFASLKRLGKKSGRNYIYPLWVRAETPFDFENKDHVQRVVDYLNSEFDSWGRGKGKYIGPDLSMGRWNVIESKDVQNALKRLGFDSFYVKENDQKNLAVFGANQIKSITGNIGDFSLESKNMKLSLRDATEMFEPKEVAKKSQTDYKSRSKLVSMRIDDFLSLSKSGVEPSKTALARDRVQDKIQFTSIPYLYVDTDGEGLRVVGHEGRHRARALKEAGFTHMPVDLRTDNIRWSEQNDPDKYDYIKDWPVDIKAQSGAVSESFSIPMPVTREDATKNYEVPGAKLSLPVVSSAVEDRVNATTQPRVKEGWTKRMMDTIFPESFSSLRQGLINRYNQLSVYDRMLAEKMGGVELMADQRAESAALFSDLSAGVVSSALGVGERNGGVPVFKNGFTTIDTSTKGLTEILAPLARYNNPKIYQYYQYWSAVKRGTRLISEGRERLIEKGDIAYAQELQKQFPEFVQIQKEFNEFNNGLMAYAVSTNIISKEAAAEYTKYADYVPFYRQLNGEQTVGPRVFNAITGVKPPRKLKGGEAPLSDFLENSVRNVQAIVNAGMKNSAGLRAIDVAMKLGPDVGAEKLNQASSSPDTVTVLENGKPTSYRVADQLFIDAVKSLNMAEIPFIGFLSKPSEVLRNLVTRDPGFMFANLLRDSLSAYVTSGVKMTPIVGTMTNFTKALANKNPSMNALFNAGIIGGYEFSANVEASGERLGKDLEKKFGSKTAAGIALRPFTWTWEALEKGTTASDAATRTLIYDRVLAETGNEMEALSRALEVMNFNRRGSSSLIRILTASVPFLNARIQGLDVFYRASSGAMNNNDAKSIQKSFFIRGATMVWLSTMYFMAVSGDDEYQKQEQETKDNNWIIPSLKVKIPIPFEVGTLFKTIPERILALSFGEDTNKDFFEAMQRALLNTFAFNPTPQAIKPILETVVNYNFFTTRPLISQGMEDVAPRYQYTPNTSELAKWLGKEIGMSPIKIDHIIRGYTGTLGGYAVSLTDAALETVGASTKASKTFSQLPLVKRFAIDPDARGRVSDFYDLKNSIDQFVRTSNLLAKTAQPEKYQEYVKSNIGLALVKQRIRDMDKVMAKLREGRDRVQNMDINPDAKRDLLTKIGRLENNTVANIQLIKRISTASSIEEAREIISRQ